MYDVIEKYLKVYDCTIYASNGMYVNTQLEPSIVNEADGNVIDEIFLYISLWVNYKY